MQKAFCWKDASSWPENWPGIEVGPESQEAHELGLRFAQEYESILAYHACRPLDISSYYKEGLRPARQSDLIKTAVKIFAGGQFSVISEEDVLRAASELPGTADTKTFIVLDDRALLEFANHYLLYGSEYITAIAAGLSRKYGHDYTQYLKNFGRPTVFELEIPLTWLTKSDLRVLAWQMSLAAFNDAIARLVDFTVTLHRGIPPEYIKSHTHPKVMQDTLTGIRCRENGELA